MCCIHTESWRNEWYTIVWTSSECCIRAKGFNILSSSFISYVRVQHWKFNLPYYFKNYWMLNDWWSTCWQKNYSYLWEEWKERQMETSEDISSKFSNMRFVSLEVLIIFLFELKNGKKKEWLSLFLMTSYLPIFGRRRKRKKLGVKMWM